MQGSNIPQQAQAQAPAAPMPGFAPAAPGSFAGGNSRMPSVAPGSYTAPVAPAASGIGSYPGTLSGVPSPYAQQAPVSGMSPYGSAPGTLSGVASPYAQQAPVSGMSAPQPYPQHGPPAIGSYPGSQAPAPAPVSYVAAQPVAAQPVAVPKPAGSKTGLIIGVLAVVVAGVGITLAVVLSGGGGGKGGAGSRDELVAQTLAAMNAGDVDALLALAGPEDMQAQFADCKPPASSDPDAKQMRDELRKSYDKTVSAAKGITAELVEVTGDDKTVLAKGKEVGRCTMKTDVATVEVKTKLKIVYKEKPAKEQAVAMTFVEIDGRWFLAAPPAIKMATDCVGALAKSMKASQDVLKGMELGEAAIARLEHTMVQRCSDDSWSIEVVECVAKVKSDAETERCMKKLPAAQRKALENDLAAIIEEEQLAKATAATTAKKPEPAGDPLPPEEPIAAPSSDDLPAACEDWGKQVEKLQSCKKLGHAQRTQMKDSYTTMIKGWEDIPNKNATLRESFEKTCRAGVEAILELRKGCK
ncbi:MAG: hypothetical protein ABI867_20645 [Kofleriaceae bacterium]